MYENLSGLPSVTQILRPWVDADWFLPEHAERGTAVHAACSAHINGAYVPPLRTDHQLYFDSFCKWAEVSIDTVVLSETRLLDKDIGFCGKPDAVITLKGSDKLVLAEWKTSQAHQKSWGPQTSAYAHLCARSEQIIISRRISVRLKSDGSGCLVTDYSGPTDWNLFLSALNCFRFFA